MNSSDLKLSFSLWRCQARNSKGVTCQGHFIRVLVLRMTCLNAPWHGNALRVTGPLWREFIGGNPPIDSPFTKGQYTISEDFTERFPSQRASNAESVSVSWRHHDVFLAAGYTSLTGAIIAETGGSLPLEFTTGLYSTATGLATLVLNVGSGKPRRFFLFINHVYQIDIIKKSYALFYLVCNCSYLSMPQVNGGLNACKTHVEVMSCVSTPQSFQCNYLSMP